MVIISEVLHTLLFSSSWSVWISNSGHGKDDLGTRLWALGKRQLWQKPLLDRKVRLSLLLMTEIKMLWHLLEKLWTKIKLLLSMVRAQRRPHCFHNCMAKASIPNPVGFFFFNYVLKIDGENKNKNKKNQQGLQTTKESAKCLLVKHCILDISD